MTLSRMFIIVIGICWAIAIPVNCQPLPHGLIMPGDSVAGVKLGSSLTDFKAVFPKHTAGDQSWDDDLCGNGGSYQWVDVDLGATGVYAYYRDNKIYQIRVQTPRFSLSNGLKQKTTEEKVKRLYPNGKAYVLKYSGSDAVGGRDLQYWVDREAGIAFELYWDRVQKRRLVRSIDVFPVGAEYQPQGCVSPPREWIKVGKVKKSRNGMLSSRPVKGLHSSPSFG